jgi:DNA-binding winged helix-turn-helix (wHTH) protein
MRLSDGPDEIRFGRFRLDLRRGRLLHDGDPVELGGRALDVLRELASAEGAVVSKDERMIRHQFVERLLRATFKPGSGV